MGSHRAAGVCGYIRDGAGVCHVLPDKDVLRPGGCGDSHSAYQCNDWCVCMDGQEEEIGHMGDVFDEHNMPGAESTVYDSEIKTDIKITGAMKAFFILCGFVGAVFSLFQMGIFQAVIWCVAVVFIMDLMGMTDSLGKFIKESGGPRGGYDNVDR